MSPKPRYEADLHCHTTASDGLLSPADLVRHAFRKGLKALAITDHDTIKGWNEAEEAAESLGIELIPGIEINTDWEGREVHILGFGMEKNNQVFQNELHALQHKRVARIEKILEVLEKLRIEISLEDVLNYAGGESVGRPHVAQAMVEKGWADNVHSAFEHYLKRGAPAYVPRYKLSPVEAIRMIRQAGGAAVLAHPGHSRAESMIQIWVEEGLQGIEVVHPDHSADDSRRYRQIAEKSGLIATGGSDYHGHGIKPGIELGDWGTGLDVVEQLKEITRR